MRHRREMAALTAGIDRKEESKRIRIAVATLGCKVNQCESAGIAEKLTLQGMTQVPFEESADCYIINTCTVTCRTDYQSRQLIRRATRRNPAAAVLVTGCYAQRAPGEIARIPGVRFIVGNAEKDRIPDIIREMISGDRQTRVGEIRKERRISRLGATVFPEHTRAFLKIQDGCDAFCSYCIIPHVRGKSRSLPRAEIEERITALVRNGYREVVLTGIHLGAWGCDLRPKTNLASLVQQIIQGRTVERLRLSSVEPREVTDTLISLPGSSGTVCRHLHIPLQSGNDGILEAMGRNYDAAFFRDLFRRIDGAVPGIAVGIDVIAGFPGETEKAFSDTLHLIEESPIAYLHVFPYSRRPGTPAATMSGQVPEKVKKRRAEQLRAVGAEKRRRFAERFIGSPLNVLVEHRTDRATGLPIGFSDNYIPVAVRGRVAANTIVPVVPFLFREDRLIADVIPE
ncbi:MAG: tRNA (N(6)-L-threonylcarbamoyladenosine(37)-C(2))-methylthiotransferase MtaB [Syntrophales bacterium]|nr:tRNA (N(6)-L-threonylcarbamoyladenosine(37)-C(2))-methylthiotransferase MtaB [Syntrophales bacterium]